MSSPLGYNPIGESAPGLPQHDRGLPGHVPSPYTPISSPDTTSYGRSYGGSAGGAVAYGPPSAMGRLLARVFAAVVLWALLPRWSALYPLVTGAGLVAGGVMFGLLRIFEPGLDLSSQIAFSSLGYLAPLWPASRLEHRLAASSRLYRGIRHVWRLLLAGGFAYYFASDSAGKSIPPALVAVVAMHFIVRSGRLRGEWHAYLELVGLRVSRDRATAASTQ